MSILAASVYMLIFSRVILDTARAIENFNANEKLLKDVDESIKLCATPYRQKQLAEAILGHRQIQGA